MHNSAVISAWSIDAFECLTRRLFTKMSVEQISRVEMFISAFILFDQVYLTQQYEKNSVVVGLNSLTDNAIKYVPSTRLKHSDDMRDHVSFDADLHMLAFKKLAEENDMWQFQNDPDLGYELYFPAKGLSPKLQAALDSKFFTNLRLWHWCLANEMAELTQSVNMLPISLNAVSEFAIKKRQVSDMVLDRYYEYAKFHDQKFAKISSVLTTPFHDELKYVPPFFSLFLDRCKNSEDAIPALAALRKDYSAFKDLRHQFTHAITSASTVNERYDIVHEWNSAWASLVAGEFRKPDLLRRKISSADISSIVIDVITGFTKTICTNVLDHLQYRKSYNLFRVFSDIDGDIGKMETENALLRTKFGVKEIVPLISINELAYQTD